MKALLASLVIAWLLVMTPALAQDQPKSTLHVESFEDPAEQVAWLSYGVGLATFVSDHKLAEAMPAGTWMPSFEAEVFARRFQLQAWQEISESQPISYEFMEQMELIAGAGFLEEYVWRFYRRPDWPEPQDLRMSEFDAWAAANVQDHRPMTGAAVAIEP